jgi:hypothetical protein
MILIKLWLSFLENGRELYREDEGFVFSSLVVLRGRRDGTGFRE